MKKQKISMLKVTTLLLAICVVCGFTLNSNSGTTPQINDTVILKSEEPIEIETIEKNIVDVDGKTVITRFNTPVGFERVKSDSWGEYLQNLPLKPNGSKVKHFDGTYKSNTSAYCAVVDLPLKGNRNHQCADAVMRLRAEYLFSQKRYDEIEFVYVSGKVANYKTYLKGRTATKDNLWSYLCGVFAYANTYSLNKQMTSKQTKDLSIGDVFIIGGFPGHVVIVVDKCINDKGEVKFMLAQSYMPAQDIQILVGDNGEDPWYSLDFGEYLNSSEYTFSKDDLKTF